MKAVRCVWRETYHKMPMFIYDSKTEEDLKYRENRLEVDVLLEIRSWRRKVEVAVWKWSERKIKKVG